MQANRNTPSRLHTEGMSHTHIGPGDWACIGRMLRAGHSLREIARTIGKDAGSVSRHVNEYGGRDGYDAREVRRRKRMKRIAAMDSIRVIKGPLLRLFKEIRTFYMHNDARVMVPNLQSDAILMHL